MTRLPWQAYTGTFSLACFVVALVLQRREKRRDGISAGMKSGRDPHQELDDSNDR